MTFLKKIAQTIFVVGTAVLGVVWIFNDTLLIIHIGGFWILSWVVGFILKMVWD